MNFWLWIVVWWDNPSKAVRFRLPGQVGLARDAYYAAKALHGHAHWRIEW